MARKLTRRMDAIADLNQNRSGDLAKGTAAQLAAHRRAVFEGIARGNVEAHLGDVAGDDPSPDTIYDEAYTLAFDALHDAGMANEEARQTRHRASQ
jgi:hypothetical protein